MVDSVVAVSSTVRIDHQSFTVALYLGHPTHLYQWVPAPLLPKNLLTLRVKIQQFAGVPEVELSETNLGHYLRAVDLGRVTLLF